jgi:lipopolysaccharide export system protein LptA
MPILLSRLRRWVGGALIAVVLLVAGVYFYARHRVQNALQEVPEKIGLEIKQSATGFTVSKSEQGRTLFTVQAGKAVQFKLGGRAELHDVQITLYGSDSSRFDRIRGTDFEYDQQSGDVTAKGEVQIDLGANPQGLLNPDQAPPKELKDPIHLKTSGLVFNQKTGDAYTRERVDFGLPQGSGFAVGVNYKAKTSVLTLQSQVNLEFSGANPSTITAARATITKDPHQVVLDQPHLQNGPRQCSADEATLFLREDNTLDRVVAKGNVLVQNEGSRPAEVRSEELELVMAGRQDALRSAIFSGSVRTQVARAESQRNESGSKTSVSGEPMQTPPEPSMEGRAGRIMLEFGRRNVLTEVRAEDNVRLVQHQNSAGQPAASQELELTASGVNFFPNGKGGHLERADTSGAAQITLRPKTGSGPQTVVTAAKFDAHFDEAGQLTSLHGEPGARIVSQNPGQPDRISTSRVVDATFLPGGGAQSIVQEGNIVYVDGERRATGGHAKYTPTDQVLILTGMPRVSDGGMTTTAGTMRLHRATGDAFADGDVKTTYSDLKSQPGGALLSSSSPIHVTARSMSVHGNSAIAEYTGDVRLWQDANVVGAPLIKFDRDHRSMVAEGAGANGTVTTVLEQEGRSDAASGKPIPIAIASARLTYADNERKAHFEGDVVAKAADVTISAKTLDAFLLARGSVIQSLSGAGKLDKIVAKEEVVITQPGRRATGDVLTYTALEDKFVLTGGPPSIFDAEHGKITGVSLTFFRHDDRVLVEGNNSTPTVTQTRVAR